MGHELSIDDVILGNKNFWGVLDTIPKENSEFQITQFGTKKPSETRTYRQVLMELRKQSNVLNLAKHQRKRLEIKLRQKERKLAALQLSATPEQQREKIGYKMEFLRVDIEEIRYQLEDQKSLIDDSIVRCRTLLDQLKGLPKFTREQFEEQERESWGKQLLEEAKWQILERGSMQAGTADSLAKIGIHPVKAQALLQSEITQEAQQFALQAAQAARRPSRLAAFFGRLLT